MKRDYNNEQDYISKSSSADEEYSKKFNTYKDQIKTLKKLIEKIPLAKLARDLEKLEEFEEEIREVKQNINDLEKSSPSFNFNKKSQVIQNLDKARTELGKAQFLAGGYKDSNPKAASDSVEHIIPCCDYLGLAVDAMILTPKRRRA